MVYLANIFLVDKQINLSTLDTISSEQQREEKDRSSFIYVQRVPKKMSFLVKIAITTLKLIQSAKVGGVLENSGYLLPVGH